jgi:hypothetical protein
MENHSEFWVFSPSRVADKKEIALTPLDWHGLFLTLDFTFVKTAAFRLLKETYPDDAAQEESCGSCQRAGCATFRGNESPIFFFGPIC